MAKCRHYTEYGEKCLSTNTAGSGTCSMFCDTKGEYNILEGRRVSSCYEPPEPDTADKAQETPNFRSKCESEGQHKYIHFEAPHRLVSACIRCGDVKTTRLETNNTITKEIKNGYSSV